MVVASRTNEQITGHMEWNASDQKAPETTVFFSFTGRFSDIIVNESARYMDVCAVAIWSCSFQTQANMAVVARKWVYGCSWPVSDRKRGQGDFLGILLLSLDPWLSGRENVLSLYWKSVYFILLVWSLSTICKFITQCHVEDSIFWVLLESQLGTNPEGLAVPPGYCLV